MIEMKINDYRKARSNRIRIEEKLKEITVLPRHAFEVHVSRGSISDPTASRVSLRLDTEKQLNLARQLEQKTKQGMNRVLSAIQDDTLRQIIILHFYDGLSWAAISRKMQMKESTVKMRWKRFHEKER